MLVTNFLLRVTICTQLYKSGKPLDIKKKRQQRYKSGQPRGCYQANTNKKSVAAYLKDTQNSQHPEKPKSPGPF
jgi:hypothetical protein